MTKTIDWDSISKVDFDTRRREKYGQTTGKKLFQKAYADLEKAQNALEQRRVVEPILRKALLDHMVSKTPIMVISPIKNPTESSGGIVDEEDDGFYNSSPSMSEEAAVRKSMFVEVMETIPAGTELTYKSWDRTLGQWIFKSENGKEYAIYDKNVIIYQGQAIENPGLYGLLFSTSLIKYLPESSDQSKN